MFSVIIEAGMLAVTGYADADKLKSMAKEKGITAMIKTELDEYFSEKYNETGIPAEVYSAALTDEYIESVTALNIDAGFERLDGGSFDNKSGIENPELDESISTFFSDYADSIGYEKNEAYQQKLQRTIDSAYSIILEYCDIYKFSLLNSEGILEKGAKVYPLLDTAVLIGAGLVVLLAGLLLLINRKALSAVIYWAGTSALIAGILGIIPCVYLNSENYFDAFVLKQPQVFTAFTGLLYDMVDSVMTNMIIAAAIGVLLIICYAVSGKIKKKA